MKKFISLFLVLIISLFTNSKIANSLEDNVSRNESMKMEGKSILHSIFINKDDGWNYLFDAASG